MSVAHSDDAAKNLPQLLKELDSTSTCVVLLFKDESKATGSSCARREPTSTVVTDMLMHDSVEMDVLEDQQVAGVVTESATVTEEDILEEMKVTEEQIKKIEKNTRGQRTNESWFVHRQQHLTASQLGRVYKRREATSPKNLVKDILSAKKKWSKTPPSIQHGIDNEPIARELHVKEKGNQCQVDECGLHVHPVHSWLAASPDGLVTDPAASPPQGLLEIKCLYAADQKGFDPLSACHELGRNSQFCCTKDERGQISLKINHSYHCQTQGQMAITGRHWCDL